MSAALTHKDNTPSTVLRELGAERKTFRSVRGVMRWYHGEMDRRLQATRQGFETGRAPTHPEHRAQRDATFAAIAICLTRLHPASEALEVHPAPRWKHHAAWNTGECLLWLVAWHDNVEDDGSDMAERAGLRGDAGYWSRKAGTSRRVFHRRCQRVERILRVRFEAAGLLLVGRGE